MIKYFLPLFLAFGATCASWNQYPVGVPIDSDTFLFGTLTTNKLITQSNLVRVVGTNLAAIYPNMTGSGGGSVVASDVGQFNIIKDFKATNDGVVICSLTLSGNSLTANKGIGYYYGTYIETNQPFRSIDTGKTIMLYGAGADHTNCFTTTMTYVDGTHVTLGTSVSRNAAYFGVFGTPNDAPIQKALNTISNYASVDIYFPSGIYLVSTNLWGANNAQLIVPPIQSANNGQGEFSQVIKLRGPTRGKIIQAIGYSTYIPAPVGAVLWSTVTNMNGGSMIDCRNFLNPCYSSQIQFNAPRVEVEKLSVIGAWDNNGTLLNLAGASSCKIEECVISSGFQLYNLCNYPLHTNSYGAQITPSSSSGAVDVLRNEFMGFYAACTYGEHTYAFGNLFGDCKIALQYGKVQQFATNYVPTTYYQGGGHLGFWYGCDFENCGVFVYNDIGANGAIDITADGENFSDATKSFNINYWPVTNIFETTPAMVGQFQYRSTTASEPNYNTSSHVNWVHLPYGQSSDYDITNKYLKVASNLDVSGVIHAPSYSSTATAYIPTTDAFQDWTASSDGYNAAITLYRYANNTPLWEVGMGAKGLSTGDYGWFNWTLSEEAMKVDTANNVTMYRNLTVASNLNAQGFTTAKALDGQSGRKFWYEVTPANASTATALMLFRDTDTSPLWSFGLSPSYDASKTLGVRNWWIGNVEQFALKTNGTSLFASNVVVNPTIIVTNAGVATTISSNSINMSGDINARSINCTSTSSFTTINASANVSISGYALLTGQYGYYLRSSGSYYVGPADECQIGWTNAGGGYGIFGTNMAFARSNSGLIYKNNAFSWAISTNGMSPGDFKFVNSNGYLVKIWFHPSGVFITSTNL